MKRATVIDFVAYQTKRNLKPKLTEVGQDYLSDELSVAIQLLIQQMRESDKSKQIS